MCVCVCVLWHVPMLLSRVWRRMRAMMLAAHLACHEACCLCFITLSTRYLSTTPTEHLHVMLKPAANVYSTRNMPNACPEFCQKYARNIPELYQKHARHMSETCQKYVRNMPEMCQKYSRNLPELSQISPNTLPDYVRSVPEICQKYVRIMPETCQNSARILPESSQKYARNDLSGGDLSGVASRYTHVFAGSWFQLK
jgi:hypothetical protein